MAPALKAQGRISPLIVRGAMDCIREACMSVCCVTLAVGSCYSWVQIDSLDIASEACRFCSGRCSWNPSHAVRWVIDHPMDCLLRQPSTRHGPLITLRSVGTSFNIWDHSITLRYGASEAFFNNVAQLPGSRCRSQRLACTEPI